MMKNYVNRFFGGVTPLKMTRREKGRQVGRLKQGMIALGMLAIMGTLSPNAWAESCAGGAGTIVTGLNGNRYCLSNIKMNWFSAFSWCEAAGGHLANMTEACLYNGVSIVSSEVCSNKVDIFSTDFVWLTDRSSASAARVLQNWQNNAVLFNRKSTTEPYNALCVGNY